MAGRLDTDEEVQLDSMDMRAFRLSILARWGFDPEYVMEVMSPGYRRVLFAAVDAYVLEQKVEAEAMDPNKRNRRKARPKRDDFIIPDLPSRKPYPPPPPPGTEPEEVGPEALEPRPITQSIKMKKGGIVRRP